MLSTTPSVERPDPAVRFERITRRFPGVQALTDVSLEIAAGSCHALCGENGAGKSTLGKILAGIHTPDAGRMFVHGREVRFASPHDALAAGVGRPEQYLTVYSGMDVDAFLHPVRPREEVRHALGLADQNPQGLLIAGASDWIRDVAKAVKEEGFAVLLLDINDSHVHDARMAGLPAECMNILAEPVQNDLDLSGIGRLLEKGPDMYYNYYATQAVFQYTGGEGSLWREWNDEMRDFLISTQAREGHEKGSWFLPGDGHNTTGGRLYVTAMATMILEVYYRHMPIYQEKAVEEEFPE